MRLSLDGKAFLEVVRRLNLWLVAVLGSHHKRVLLVETAPAFNHTVATSLLAGYLALFVRWVHMLVLVAFLFENLLLHLLDYHAATDLAFLTSVYTDNTKSIADTRRMTCAHNLLWLLDDVSLGHDDGASGLL